MKKANILVTSLGNALEWFDYGLFIFLAPVIGKKFFPIVGDENSTIATFSVLSLGFLFRPIGGLLFGHIGDTKGRAKTLKISILIISLSTFLIGILPSYEQAGITVSILFIFIRLVHGISVGGEYSGVMIYLAESASPKNRGFVTSFSVIGANIGFILSILIIYLTKNILIVDAFNSWGWRLPFIIAGSVGFIILYNRLNLTETAVYTTMKKIQTVPFLNIFKSFKKDILRILGITCMGSTFYYVFFGYIPDYLINYIYILPNQAFELQIALLLIMIILIPLSGMLGDKFGRKRMLLLTSISIIVCVLPCLYLLQSKAVPLIILALGIATILSSVEQGNTLTSVVENFPVNIRYSGVAFSYNLGNSLFGGTAPLIVALLNKNFSYSAPGYYLIFMAIIGLVAILTIPKPQIF
ncbi:MFS transporter [Gammaproteobacteria bacterium]|nr:MFS transporter [Gammaproteobacteria bacterium]